METFTPLRTQREDSAADSDLETFAPLRTRSSTASAWVPGRQCGAFLRRGPGGSVGPQAQVLLTNTYRNCESLPRAARVVLRDHIKPVGKMRRKVTFAAEMTSWLCGVAATTVQNTVAHAKSHGPSKRPCLKRKLATRRRMRVTPTGVREERAGAAAAAAGAAAAEEEFPGTEQQRDDEEFPAGARLRGFRNLLRINAMLSANGLPRTMLPAIAHTVVEARGDVGTNYCNRKFGTLFDRSMFNLCKERVRLLLEQPLGGTGRPPELEFIADGVSVGTYFGRSGSSVLLCGGIVSVPDPPYAAEIFFGAESQGTDERAPAAMERMGRAVWCITGVDMKTFMQTRVASNCGDGQLCAGGEEAKHPSTAAMNKLWTDVAKVDGDNASWDAFHQFNVAGSDALSTSAQFQKFCDVLKQLEHMSALGQGKELRSGLAEYLGKPDLVVRAICGHRKTGYISGVPGRWLDNFRLDYDSYNLRMRRALDGRGSHSFQHYKAKGEAFSAPSLVVFVLAICGGFETVVQPANLRAQDAADLPMERWSAWQKTAEDLRAVAAQIRGVRAFLRRMFLIAAYIADEPVTLRRYWFCFGLSPDCNLLHTRGRWCLPAHLFPIFFEREIPGVRATFAGTAVHGHQ